MSEVSRDTGETSESSNMNLGSQLENDIRKFHKE